MELLGIKDREMERLRIRDRALELLRIRYRALELLRIRDKVVEMMRVRNRKCNHPWPTRNRSREKSTARDSWDGTRKDSSSRIFLFHLFVGSSPTWARFISRTERPRAHQLKIVTSKILNATPRNVNATSVPRFRLVS